MNDLYLEELITLLEDLPLEQKITLKCQLEIMIANCRNRVNLLSDEELLFISNLFEDT